MNNTYLEFVDLITGAQRISIHREITRMGREPGSEVAIAPNAANVSRRHAEIRLQGGQYILVDLGSFNGTFLNGRRVVAAEILQDSDKIELGPAGPSFRFRNPANADSQQNARFAQAGGPSAAQSGGPALQPNQTIVAHAESGSLRNTARSSQASPNEPQVFLQRAFDRAQLTIGRANDSDVRLDGLLISNLHARISQTTEGLIIEDLNSTNGTYVNGERITGRRHLPPEDVVQVGPFLLRANVQRGVTVFDTRAKTRIDVVRITKEVRNRSGSGKNSLGCWVHPVQVNRL
jgi:pSer/pThr/pTyr-binding forkhead associated (FHA) protein